MQYPGLAVSAGRAGQRRAGSRPALTREGTDLLAEPGGRGDEDRCQYGAGGLAGLDGVVTVDHQQPQSLPVSVGAHLRWPRAGQQLAGCADGVDRVALTCPALADVPGAVDLATSWPARQVPGQAQPVVPGALDRPRQPPARGSGTAQASICP